MKKIKVSSKSVNRALVKAIKIIKEKGVIVCPTDTVYGLLAKAQDEKAVKRLLKIKKRQPKKPLPVFVKDLKRAKSLAFINKTQENFLKKIWPGKVTTVLKAKLKKFPKGILNKDKKIGLRIPDYKFLNILLRRVDHPLTATSANISGKPASTKIKEILKQFENQEHQPELILDVGNLRPSLPSTVIDLTNNKILRRGEISKNKILGWLKED